MRAEWDRDISAERSRARIASVALAVTGATRLVDFALVSRVPTSVVTLGLAELVLLVVTAVVFLRWLARAVSFAQAMSPTRLRWTSSSAVWSFFVPIVALWRPYQVVRDLHDALAPSGVPEPAPTPILDGSGGYRHVAMKSAPPPRALPHASIGAWWGFFMATRLVGFGGASNQEVLGTFFAMVSAALGILVVRAIDGRIAERFRRVRHASDEELDAWKIRA